MTWNLMHTARILKEQGGFPAYGNQPKLWADGCRWDNEPPAIKEQFREFACNAIRLLNQDIGVLLLALEQSSAEERVEAVRSAA